jgi:hypothetical protein
MPEDVVLEVKRQIRAIRDRGRTPERVLLGPEEIKAWDVDRLVGLPVEPCLFPGVRVMSDA